MYLVYDFSILNTNVNGMAIPTHIVVSDCQLYVTD